ncbi:MAG: glycosyltransferase [Hyphomonadaceae bacterium]|nr:glycosyltransferase [Hyphomonadaceae bacterium]
MTLVHALGSSSDGGAEKYFIDLTAAFARAGIAQSAALRVHDGRIAQLGALGVEARVLPFSKPLDFTTGPAIAALAKARQAKVVLAWMNRAASLTPAGPYARIGRLGGYYKLKNYRGFDALVGNTQDIVDWMVREGWPEARAHYIPNFATAGDAAPIDRAVHDTPADAPLLLGMGRLHEAKAHDVSLKALVELPEAYLWIAGAGPEEAKLKALAAELGVAPRVRFLGWRDDSDALYHTVDVCVFPSRFEPLGNTVIQAWAHGAPIVAAASKGPGALIRDGEDGFLVPIDNPLALAEKVRLMLADAPLRQRLAAAGRARMTGTEFAEAAVVARWRALFAQFGGV